MVRLVDVCKFQRGLTYKKSDEVAQSDNIVLRSNNIDLEQGVLDLRELKCIREDLSVPDDKKVMPGSILMCMANGSKSHLGKVALVQDDLGYAFGGFMGLLVPEGIDSSYLYLALRSAPFKECIRKLQDGANINNLKFSDFCDFPIPLPPLPVQREIVARLEKELGEADALAAKFKEIAENADAEFKAELDETFKNVEGEKVRLGDVFKFIDYRGMTPVKTESGVPLITAKNVRQGFLDYKEESFISNEDYKNRQTRGIAHKGDILFTTEAPLGFVALADKDEFSTGQRIITFQQKHDDSNWCNKYFLYCLMSDWFQKQLWRQATGATAKGIKSSRLIELPVLVISSQCQKAIAGRLDKIKSECEKLKAAAERGLRAAEDLRKAILAEAFEQ